MPTATPDPAATELPAVPPEAVRALYADFVKADRYRASSNDITQMLDDWFVAEGYPTVLYR